MEWVYYHTQHVKALKYLRDEFLDRKLCYREMAEMLTAYSGVAIQKSNAWNATNRPGKCPTAIRTALENMGLLDRRPRRLRFFFEVGDEFVYRQVQSWLEGDTFSERMWELRLWE